MQSPLRLRLCCLAAMAPALTSEVATRARDKLPGAPSPTSGIVGGRGFHTQRGSPEPGGFSGKGECLDLPKQSTFDISAGVVVPTNGLSQRALGGQLRAAAVTQRSSPPMPRQSRVRSPPKSQITNLTPSTLRVLYQQPRKEGGGRDSQPVNQLPCDRGQHAALTDMNQPARVNEPGPSSNTSSSSSTSSPVVFSSSNKVNRQTMSPLIPVANTISATTPGIASNMGSTSRLSLVHNNTIVPLPSGTIIRTGSSVGVQHQGSTLKSTMDAFAISRPNNTMPSTSTGGIANGVNQLLRKAGPTSISRSVNPAGHLRAPSASATVTSGVLTAAPEASPAPKPVPSAEAVARRQRELQSRADRLRRRLRRMQCKQSISHVKHQLSGFVEHQNGLLLPLGGGPSANAGQVDLKAELLQSKDVKSLSTAALVSLVHKLQQSSQTASGLRQHFGGASQDPDEPPYTRLEEEQCLEFDRVSGHLASNLCHLQRAADSDATESSSGGESCDDLDQDDDWDGRASRPPITRRCEWRWSADRSHVAARWTWLQAQVSDLEYRIRQQNDIYRQIRSSKGAVVLGEPPPPEDLLARVRGQRPGKQGPASSTESDSKQPSAGSNETSPANVSVLLSNVDKQSSHLTQQLGNVYSPQCSPLVSGSNRVPTTPKTPSTPNGFIDTTPLKNFSENHPGSSTTPEQCTGPPAPPSSSTTTSSTTSSSAAGPATGPKRPEIPALAFEPPTPVTDHSCQAARCRPVKSYRKRRLLRTSGLHLLNRKAARLSTVRCQCYPPATPCAMCGGRYNNSMSIEPGVMPLFEKVALVDPSFHPVLSFSEDIPQSVLFESMLKTGEWQQKPPPRPQKVLPSERRSHTKERVRKYTRRVNKNASAALLSSTKIRNKYENKQTSRSTTSPVKPVASDGTRLSRSDMKIKKRKAALHAIETIKRKNCLGGLPGGRTSHRSSGSRERKDSQSPLTTSQQAAALRSMQDAMKKRRPENSFDIDNIVIPYSIAASTRVEKLQYKEILTPKWRRVLDALDNVENSEEMPDVTPEVCLKEAVTLPPSTSSAVITGSSNAADNDGMMTAPADGVIETVSADSSAMATAPDSGAMATAPTDSSGVAPAPSSSAMATGPTDSSARATPSSSCDTTTRAGSASMATPASTVGMKTTPDSDGIATSTSSCSIAASVPAAVPMVTDGPTLPGAGRPGKLDGAGDSAESESPPLRSTAVSAPSAASPPSGWKVKLDCIPGLDSAADEALKTDDEEDEEIEDLCDEVFRVRHLRCEVKEKKRYNTVVPLNNPRRRGNRTDSFTSTGALAEPMSPDGGPADSGPAAPPAGAPPPLVSVPLAAPTPIITQPGAPTTPTRTATPAPGDPTAGGVQGPTPGGDGRQGPAPDGDDPTTPGGDLADAMKRTPSIGSLRLEDTCGRRRSGSVSSRGSGSYRSRSTSHSEERGGGRVAGLVEGFDPAPVVPPWPRRTFPLRDDYYSLMVAASETVGNGLRLPEMTLQPTLESTLTPSLSPTPTLTTPATSTPTPVPTATSSSASSSSGGAMATVARRPGSPARSSSSTSTSSDIMDEDPDDPEWTVISEHSQQIKRHPGLVIKLAKR